MVDTSTVEDGELVAGADVDADEKKDSDASVQADSEADAETGMADTTANTEAAAEADGAAHARSGIETDTETGVRSDFCAIVDVGGIGKTWVNAETDADEDAVADGEADGKESAADTEADTDADAVTNTGVETDVETRPEPDARVETDVHADTEPKRAGNIGSHAKAAAGLEAAQVAKSTTVTAGVPRANGDDVGTVCAGEWSSASQKRICNDTSNNDQPPKRARVAGSPATSQSEEKMPSKAYLTNKNAIDSRNLGKSQPLSTPDEGRAVKEREKDLLYARYDLQRMLLRKTSAPSELDVSTAGELLTSLKLRPDLEWDLIQATRIYKALKKVRDLSSIPGDRGDALRTRCATLLDAWERGRRVDSGTPSTTDQESMTHSEVAVDGNASKGENGHDMGEVRTASVDDSA